MNLHDSQWLATKLGISISTIERLRACESDDIPKAIIINRSIRYCEHYVEWWIQKRLSPDTPDYAFWYKELYGSSNGRKFSAPKKNKTILLQGIQKRQAERNMAGSDY